LIPCLLRLLLSCLLPFSTNADSMPINILTKEYCIPCHSFVFTDVVRITCLDHQMTIVRCVNL
jgi:hypothetical protein